MYNSKTLVNKALSSISL